MCNEVKIKTRAIFIITLLICITPFSAKAGALIGLVPEAAYYVLVATDPSTGVKLPSPGVFAPGGEIFWTQLYDREWETDVRVGVKQVTFQSPTSFTYENASQLLPYFSAAISKRPYTHFKISLEGQIARYSLLSSVNTTTMALNSADWPSLGIRWDLTFLQIGSYFNKFTARFKGLARLLIPNTPDYGIGVSNYEYGVSLGAGYERRRWALQGSLFLNQVGMSSSLLAQSLSSTGISLGWVFKLGSAELEPPDPAKDIGTPIFPMWNF